MKTILSLLHDIFPESFDRPDPALWHDAPSYRPGMVLIPVDRKGPGVPGRGPGRGYPRKKRKE